MSTTTGAVSMTSAAAILPTPSDVTPVDDLGGQPASTSPDSVLADETIP